MIRRIFMLQGTIIGVVGTLLGYVLGIGWRSSSNDTNSSNFHRGFIRWITCPSCSIGLISSWSRVRHDLMFPCHDLPGAAASSLEPAEALRFE